MQLNSLVSSVFSSLKINKIRKLSLAMALVGLSAGGVYASGFQLWEQDASGIGDYHSGYATPDNASAAFYNPAALPDLPKMQLSTGVTLIQLHLPFEGTVTNAAFIGQTTYSASANGGGSGPKAVPNFYISLPASDRLTFAIGAATPFGLETDYGDDTELKYVATNTSLRTADITPSFGYKVNDTFSLGAGLDVEYLWGDFDQYAGFGAPGVADTSSLNNGDSWGLGYHFGFIVNISPDTKFGFAYHSRINHTMRGDSKFKGPIALGGYLESNNLTADIDLPATSSVTLTHRFNPKWKILGTVDYTQWHEFKNLILNNVALIGGSTGSVTIHEGFRNTWNVALGAHYQMNDQIMWKAGIGFDQTPTNNTYRNIQLPGGDRFALSVGIQANVSKNAILSAGYTRLFQANAGISSSQAVIPGLAVTTNGSVNHGAADVVGLQLIMNIT